MSDGTTQTGADDALVSLLSSIDEALLVFESADGSIVWANRAACDLLGATVASLLGSDVRDRFYTDDLTRLDEGDLPFAADGSRRRAMAKLTDGSFVPVVAHSLDVPGRDDLRVAMAYFDEQFEAQREHRRLVDELAQLNARLRGTLSIISCASLGDNAFEEFALHVANELQRVMSADAAVLYLADDFGFEPYGVSGGFDALGIQKTYLPVGVGVPTLVSRNRRTTRLQLVSPPAVDAGAIMLDLDMDTRFRLRSMLAECCSTIVGTPVFSYDRVVAVVIVGWLSPRVVNADDVRLLDTVADFLSVEFAAAVTQMEQKRSARFSDAMNEVRELVRGEGEVSARLAAQIAQKITPVVPSRILIMESNPFTGMTFVRLHGEEGEPAETLEFTRGMDEVFPGDTACVEIEAGSPCGLWVGRHTDLSQGFGVLLSAGESRDDSVREALLVMRGANDRPFDEGEQAFLRGLAKEVGTILHAEQERVHDAEIARALQVGLRNELPEAHGVTTSSLYISATESAVVGGDFFDLYDLSDGHIVVVMGDVSGKGVEAAAMASLVKTALAAYAWNYLDPASMVASLNNLFLNFSRLETFASLVVVAIDFNEMHATYCSAGHPPAMVVHRPGTPMAELRLLTSQSPIVGAFENLDYINGTFPLEIGDILYLYTDGTTEARNANGDFFGEDTLREVLLRACRSGIEGVPQSVLREVEAFAGGDLHDDIAMVAVRFDGLPETGSDEIAGEVRVPRPGDAAAALDADFARFTGKEPAEVSYKVVSGE